jgi:hypothetical protein
MTGLAVRPAASHQIDKFLTLAGRLEAEVGTAKS